MVIALFIVFCWNMYKKYQPEKALKKIVVYSFSFIFLFALIFSVSGSIRSTNHYSMLEGFESFVFYAACPIPALNRFVLSGVNNQTTYFGAHTFLGFYSFFSRFCDSFKNVPSMPLEPQFLNTVGEDYYVNIYSAFRRYIQDFGYAGASALTILFGLFYGFVFSYWKKKQFSIALLPLICFVVYPLVEIGIEDRFYTYICSAPGVFISFCCLATAPLFWDSPKAFFGNLSLCETYKI